MWNVRGPGTDPCGSSIKSLQLKRRDNSIL